MIFTWSTEDDSFCKELFNETVGLCGQVEKVKGVQEGQEDMDSCEGVSMGMFEGRHWVWYHDPHERHSLQFSEGKQARSQMEHKQAGVVS